MKPRPVHSHTCQVNLISPFLRPSVKQKNDAFFRATKQIGVNKKTHGFRRTSRLSHLTACTCCTASSLQWYETTRIIHHLIKPAFCYLQPAKSRDMHKYSCTQSIEWLQVQLKMATIFVSEAVYFLKQYGVRTLMIETNSPEVYWCK